MRTAKMISARRELTTAERDLIEWLLHHGEVGASDYLPQLAYTSVASHCDCGCPTIGLAVTSAAASVAQPSGIISDVRAVTPEGGDVGLMLHAAGGFLEELEAYPIGDTPATFSLPKIDTIQLLAPNRNI
jgi:hypothetical protein